MNARQQYWLLQLFEQAAEGKFFGTLEFGFKHGALYLCRKTETMLIPAGDEPRPEAAPQEARV